MLAMECSGDNAGDMLNFHFAVSVNKWTQTERASSFRLAVTHQAISTLNGPKMPPGMDTPLASFT